MRTGASWNQQSPPRAGTLGRGVSRPWFGLIAGWVMAFACNWQHCTAQIPDDVLKQLAADEFKVREHAERDLARWAFDNRDMAYHELYLQAREHSDAEVRLRCLSVLKQLVQELYDGEGEGYVGIRMMDESVQLPDREEMTAALLVNFVMPDSPAERGGLQMGDYILSLEQEPWKALPVSEDFRSRIKAMKPRSIVRLKVLRGKEILELAVTLARRPAAMQDAFAMPGQEQIDAMEAERREQYFKKWLLQRRNAR